MDQIWSKSMDPNSSYGDDKRFEGTIFNILIRKKSEKNVRPLNFLPVVCLAPGHPWTKFGPNRSLLTQVMVAFQTDRHTRNSGS